MIQGTPKPADVGKPQETVVFARVLTRQFFENQRLSRWGGKARGLRLAPFVCP